MVLEFCRVINDLAPVFRPYIQYVYQELKLGLCKTEVDFERILGNSESGECQFRIILPYCSKKLKWDVIFDLSSPWFAPDFRFDDDSFLMHVDDQFIEENIPSLVNWNENDPRALMNVIAELVNTYKFHQIKKLNDDECSRACFEYSALLGDALTSAEDIEVWVGNHVAEFLIRINVDTSRLPELYNDGIEENPGIDTALLLVRYPNSTNAELILSPLLSKALGQITLPLMHQTGVLMDYVPMVTELLNNKIQEVLSNEKLKRDLLAQLVVKYEGAILEHDANNAAFLFEKDNFHWILHIDISIRFPDKLPVLTIRSVYHSNKGKPLYQVLQKCPYNNFEAYILQQVEIFKNKCMGLSNTSILSIDN